MNENTRLKITENLLAIERGGDELVLTDYVDLRPLYVKKGRAYIRRCIPAEMAKGQVIGNLYYLRSRGRAVHEGETWRPVDGKPAQAAPVRTRKRRATQPAAAEPAASGPAEPRMTTADLFLEQLESGPATTRELLTGAQRAGKPVANEHMASNILRTLEKRGQVRQGDGERWERVK